MILPAVKEPFLGQTVSYLNAVESGVWQIIFLTATAIALALGLPRLVSRVTGVIAIIFICSPIYNLISASTEMYGRNKSFFNKRMFNSLVEQLQIGAPLMVITLILFMLILLLPKYQTNLKFVVNQEATPVEE